MSISDERFFLEWYRSEVARLEEERERSYKRGYEHGLSDAQKSMTVYGWPAKDLIHAYTIMTTYGVVPSDFKSLCHNVEAIMELVVKDQQMAVCRAISRVPGSTCADDLFKVAQKGDSK